MSETLIPPPPATRPDELAGLDLPAGSMGPKVEAACGFARNTGKEAVIGSLTDIAEIITGTAGTRVHPGPTS